MSGAERLESRRFLAADAAAIGAEAGFDEAMEQISAPAEPGSNPGTTSARLTEAPLAGSQKDGFLSDALEETIASLANSPQSPAPGGESPVFLDGAGVVHIYVADQADLVAIYEFGAFGVTLNGQLYSFDLAEVRHAKVHGLGRGDLLAVSDGVQKHLETANSSSVELRFASPYAGAEGENYPPSIYSPFCYEDSYDMWVFQGAVANPDGTRHGLRVEFEFLGVGVGDTLTLSNGSFRFAHYIEPPEYGYMSAVVTDDQGLTSAPAWFYVNNMS